MQDFMLFALSIALDLDEKLTQSRDTFGEWIAVLRLSIGIGRVAFLLLIPLPPPKNYLCIASSLVARRMASSTLPAPTCYYFSLIADTQLTLVTLCLIRPSDMLLHNFHFIQSHVCGCHVALPVHVLLH